MRLLILSAALFIACGKPPCSYRGLEPADGHERDRALLPPDGQVCGWWRGIGLVANYKKDPHPLFVGVVRRMESGGWQRTRQKTIDEMGLGHVTFERRTADRKLERANFGFQPVPENKSLTEVTVQDEQF